MTQSNWRFHIDVGGTFTDVVAQRPDSTLKIFKLLSSGVVRGVVDRVESTCCIQDCRRIGDPEGFWKGFELTLLGPSGDGQVGNPVLVEDFDADTGRLTLAADARVVPETGCSYQLSCGEEAPVVAIRYLMGLGLGSSVGAIDVRLGTTRATNALLERKGARTAFVTTAGFADILQIGYQDRSDLFDLHIRKREELYCETVEIDERVSAAGEVLVEIDKETTRQRLKSLKECGIDALAVCLLNAHLNSAHEVVVGEIARSLGFKQISISTEVSKLERIVSRGDTTVVDAYLGSVIRGYVDSLRRSLPDARMMLMTSAGGLVEAGAVQGKDTLLSGPAGGVVGCAEVARQAGFSKAIGFDMGGTSTDVSRIDFDSDSGPFEYQHETVKAGVRVMTPMLGVETVAAGGGSICSFDGQKLLVGPESAGAAPGPACYGRGGPLTVTDMNVYLGRVPAELFPFPLNLDAVGHQLSALCDTLQSAGFDYDMETLAEGFLRIANTNMAAPIKQVSIARGFDVRDHALVSFGGAGGQHACAIARILGMSKIVLSPFAGVLSAYGIASAEVKRIAEQSVDVVLDSELEDRLSAVLDSLNERLRSELAAQGYSEGDLLPERTSVDLCYEGQASTISLSLLPIADLKARFENMHRQLYGYVHDGRAVHVRVVSIELAVRGEDAPVFDLPGRAGDLSAFAVSEASFDGRRLETPIYRRAALDSGDSITGPAIVIDETSTVVIEPGWQAELSSSGDIVLADVAGAAAHESISIKADPIHLELFSNQFTSIAEQMGSTLRRTALSTNVKERLDFSCAIFSPGGDLVVNAPHIPVHLGGMVDCVKALIDDVGIPSPGEVWVTNDPYRGGSHLNDVTVISPVHDRDGGRVLFYVANRAHHAEIGGKRPGSMPPDSSSLAEEGVVIRATRWIVNGQPQHDCFRELLTGGPYPSRAPDHNLADIAAQVAANQTGIRELTLMAGRYGSDVVHSYMEHIRSAAEEKMRLALGRIADGEHRFEDHLDDGSRIAVAIFVEGDQATIDFSGTDPVLSNNLNANPAIVSSAVLYCLRCLVGEQIPLNSGVLAPVRIVLPTCLLNPPSHTDPAKCPPVAAGNVETSQRIVDAVLGALGIAAASQGTMNNLLFGDARFGYYETICGGAGAGDGFAGASAVHTNMTNTRITDPEVLESSYPVRLVRFEVRRGSGGDGRFRGGDGVIRELEFLAPLEVSIISQRRQYAPYGLRCGAEGLPGRNVLLRGPEETILPSVVQLDVLPGDRLIVETPGGGGYGAAL